MAIELNQIPRTFWNSVSFAVVALTIGLLVFGYRSTSISIEIANTKIGLSQAVTETERINSELQERADALARAKAELEAEVDRLNRELARSGEAKPIKLAMPKADLERIEHSRDALNRNQDQLETIKSRLIDVRQAALKR
jgi:chromosome segregation ATPase